MTTLGQRQTDIAQVTFPPGFIWGTATASYQIEGAAKEDGRGESIWDRFSHTPGKVQNGDTGDIACDHYHRWPEDITLMQSLGVSAYRFSVAWPRIIPGGRGAVNQKGLDFYDKLVDGLLAAGIMPCVTLYHWDLPQVLQDKGGWTNRDTAYAFAEYTEAVVRRLGDRVKSWITHNEPWCASFLSYEIGEHAPGLHDSTAATQAVHHLLLSHGLALPVIRQFAPQAEAGITLNFVPVHPARPVAEDAAIVRKLDASQHRVFLDPLFKGTYPADFEGLPILEKIIQPGDMAAISAPRDFLGINFYNRTVVQADPAAPQGYRNIKPEGVYTEMDWEIYPPALYELLTRLGREYPSKYYITENGAATADHVDANGQVNDDVRLDYLREHFRQTRRAMSEGVNVAGYFVWSLLDNFEWAYGYSKRFGITYVDFATQQRIIKKSGRWYARVIDANGFAPGE